jgi:hypothetical protein
MSFLLNPFVFAGAAGDFESIATVTVGSGGASSIEFTSIPGTYQHLQVRMIARSDRSATGDEIAIRLNSDTGNNYAYHALYGTGTSATAFADSSTNKGYVGYGASGATATANVFGATVVDILDYASTSKTSTVRAFGCFDNNGSGAVILASALWNNTNAVTTVRLLPWTGTNFLQHSTAALYGIKA